MSKKKVGRKNPGFHRNKKKYRNNNGASHVSISNRTNLNQELDLLHQQLQTFAVEKYGDEIKKQSQLFEQPSLKGKQELIDIYFTGLSLWIITKQRFLDNKKTILELFYQMISSRLHPIVKQLFSRWMKANPSIYEVISVPEESQGMVELRDLLTNKHFSIPFHVGDEYIKGSLIIGTLVPFAGYYSFLLTIIKLYGHNRDAILEMINQYAKKKGSLSAHFPEVLAEALLLGIQSDEETNPLYEHVAQTFADHMVEKGINDAVILQGLDLWRKFCKQKNPSFKKASPYVAALDYYVQKNLLGNSEITQSTVAKEYDATLSTVSTNYRKLSNMIEAEMK